MQVTAGNGDRFAADTPLNSGIGVAAAKVLVDHGIDFGRGHARRTTDLRTS